MYCVNLLRILQLFKISLNTRVGKFYFPYRLSSSMVNDGDENKCLYKWTLFSPSNHETSVHHQWCLQLTSYYYLILKHSKSLHFHCACVHTIEIDKERMASPKLTREIVYEKRRQTPRAWADLLINCGNFMSSS